MPGSLVLRWRSSARTTRIGSHKACRSCGLLEAWDFIECADGDVSRAKPSPALYLSALERLGIAPSEAIAIEDSPNGIRAAKRARIYTLAVPNKTTRLLDTSEADRIVMSLEELPLGQLVHDVESGRP